MFKHKKNLSFFFLLHALLPKNVEPDFLFIMIPLFIFKYLVLPLMPHVNLHDKVHTFCYKQNVYDRNIRTVRFTKKFLNSEFDEPQKEMPPPAS